MRDLFGRDVFEQFQMFPAAPPVTAHCGAEMAAWLDPDGSLQRAGLMVVDRPSKGIPRRTVVEGCINDLRRL